MPARRWTREGILAALVKWASENGRTPTSVDATNTRALPNTATVYLHFKTWNEALDDAGLERYRRTAGEVATFVEVAPVAMKLVPSTADLARLARMVAASVNGISDTEAEEAVQEAWLVLAEKGASATCVDGVRGFLYRTAKRKALHIRRRRNGQVAGALSLDSLVDEWGDAYAVAAPGSLVDQVDARIQLAALVEQASIRDDVLYVNDTERGGERVNVYQPVAQRRGADVLDGMPEGRWLEKLRAAHEAGDVSCLCWACIREAGITVPPHLAQRFPDCNGERPGALTRRREQEPSSVMASIFDAIGMGNRAAVAAA